MGLTDHAATNRTYWDRIAGEYQRAHGPQLSTVDPGWGVWQLPERDLRVLGDVRGMDVLELGCGAAQWSIALARWGARPVGLDLASGQLAQARRLMAEAGVRVPLVNASAEDSPFAGEQFDVVFCDHGAMTFCDPQRTVPEAARLLRPGGLLAFNMASPLAWLCWGEPEDDLVPELRADYFGLASVEYEHVEFQLGYGDWIRLFRRHGLVVEDLVELRPPEDARTTYEGWSLDWARRWPAENIWKVRKQPG